MKKQYMWSFSDLEECWNSDVYNSVDECIEAAQEEVKADLGLYITEDLIPTKVYVGEAKLFEINVNIDGMLEDIEQQAFDECGAVAEGWEACDYKQRGEMTELQENINKVVFDWMKKYHYAPSFYHVTDIVKYPLSIKT